MVLETLMYAFGAVAIVCVVSISVQILFLRRGELVPVRKDNFSDHQTKKAA